MKVGIVLGVIATTAVAHAGVPPSLKPFLEYSKHYYKFDDKTKQWVFRSGAVSCAEDMAAATEAGVTDAQTIDVGFDTPDWKAGARTFKELKDFCTRATRSGTVYKIVDWFKTGWDDETGDLAAKCIQFFNQWTKEQGIAPTTKLPYEGITTKDPATGDPFQGTLEEGRKKFCDSKAKKYLAAKEKQEAPYRNVLKADKLEVALGHSDKVFYGPGKRELKTPAAMATANVWFRVTWYDDKPCRNGADKTFTVTRYQFDASHKLVKDVGKDFCGQPPASAFK